MSDITVKAASILDSITVRVKGMKGAVLRVRLATAIFHVGAWVAGCPLEIELVERRR